MQLRATSGCAAGLLPRHSSAQGAEQGQHRGSTRETRTGSDSKQRNKCRISAGRSRTSAGARRVQAMKQLIVWGQLPLTNSQICKFSCRGCPPLSQQQGRQPRASPTSGGGAVHAAPVRPGAAVVLRQGGAGARATPTRGEGWAWRCGCPEAPSAPQSRSALREARILASVM